MAAGNIIKPVDQLLSIINSSYETEAEEVCKCIMDDLENKAPARLRDIRQSTCHEEIAKRVVNSFQCGGYNATYTAYRIKNKRPKYAIRVWY